MGKAPRESTPGSMLRARPYRMLCEVLLSYLICSPQNLKVGTFPISQMRMMRLNEAKDPQPPGTRKPRAETSRHALPGLRARLAPCLSCQYVLALLRNRAQAAGPQLRGGRTEPSESIAGRWVWKRGVGWTAGPGAFLPQPQPGPGRFPFSGWHSVAAHVVRPPASPGSRCLGFSQRILLVPTLCQAPGSARSLRVGTS